LLTIPDPIKSTVSLEEKMTSSENSTFSGFLQSNIKVIFCTFLAFYQPPVGGVTLYLNVCKRSMPKILL